MWLAARYIVLNIITALAVLVFASGFFPHKAFLPGLATWSTDHNVSSIATPFDKVIFMVVDALRSDFVYGLDSNFKFTQSLIRSGAAVPFTGHASPPTITMPRVKAITTGSVPSFLDVVLNFAESDTSSTLATQDTWLAQLRAKSDKKLVMYGDDTWLKLFPGFFGRADGTTSFFVSDFTEVDNNVTRHIPDELVKLDWSAMILHYLGLDHIGHKSGPKSPNMPAKQKEMDGIIQQIYKAMEESEHLQSSLLLISGDHGMNEAGNHGGSTEGEVSTALVFVSPKFRGVFDGFDSPAQGSDKLHFYDVVEQSDIAPTLAVLLGFPIPRNSLGILIPRLLELWSYDTDRLTLLWANARQIQVIAEATFPDDFQRDQTDSLCDASISETPVRLACTWRTAQDAFVQFQQGTLGASDAVVSIRAFLKLAQNMLSGTASNYDLGKMTTGIVVLSVALIIPILLAMENSGDMTMADIAFSLIIICYGIMMFASSFVEEEQQFWYWAFAGWLIVSQCKQSRFEIETSLPNSFSSFAIAFLFGVIRHWNQTGQKYAGYPDITSRVLPSHPWLLWPLLIATYTIISRRLGRRTSRWTSSAQLNILVACVSIVAFTFKIAFTSADAPELLKGIFILKPLVDVASRFSLIAVARVAFIGIGYLLILALYYEAPWKSLGGRKDFVITLHDILSLFLITQTRTSNIPVFLIFYLELYFLESNQTYSVRDMCVTSLMLQYSSFFLLGGSNAISSVDLSNAYNGVGGYNIGAVGILTFISNWAGPIWWTSATAILMSHQTPHKSQNSSTQFIFSTLFAAASTVAVMAACMVLREHLFIWTVFSPKFLFTVAWVFGYQILVNGLFGYGLLGSLLG